MVGAASGGTDPLQPLARLSVAQRIAGAPRAPQLQRACAASPSSTPRWRTAGRPVMLDFYADWCVSCKEMERFTFTDPAVRAKLAGACCCKADVTANNADDRALLRRFSLFGPPGMIFFDARGTEVAERASSVPERARASSRRSAAAGFDAARGDRRV